METHIEEQPVEIDAERQAKAREYALIRRRLSLLSLVIVSAGATIVFASGLDIWLRDILESLSWELVRGWLPVQILCYFLALIGVYYVINAPLTFYRGFVLPRRYGLSTQTFKGWLADLLKGTLLSLILEIVVIELIYLLLATQPLTWWLWVGLVMLFFSVVMANLGPVLLLPLFYKFSPLPEGDLKRRLIALADRAHTRVRGVFTMHLSSKTTAANAAVMGLGNTRRIVLGDTMLDRYTPDEIEVVLAHELGHHVHRDIWKLIISQSLFTLAGLYLVNVGLHWFVDRQYYYHGISDAATIPLVLLLSAIAGLIFMPISNAYSRAMEYQADEYALQVTNKIDAFKSMMTRLANQNLAEIEPSPVVEVLFHDHPSTRKRLNHADVFARRLAPLSGQA